MREHAIQREREREEEEERNVGSFQLAFSRTLSGAVGLHVKEY